jgi:hypothetical protein
MGSLKLLPPDDGDATLADIAGGEFVTGQELRVLALLWRLRIAGDQDRRRFADLMGLPLSLIERVEALVYAGGRLEGIEA